MLVQRWAWLKEGKQQDEELLVLHACQEECFKFKILYWREAPDKCQETGNITLDAQPCSFAPGSDRLEQQHFLKTMLFQEKC